MPPLKDKIYTLRTNTANATALSFFGRKEEVMAFVKRNVHLHYSSAEFRECSDLTATSTRDVHVLFHLMDVGGTAKYIPVPREPIKLEFHEIKEVNANINHGVSEKFNRTIFEMNDTRADNYAAPINAAVPEYLLSDTTQPLTATSQENANASEPTLTPKTADSPDPLYASVFNFVCIPKRTSLANLLYNRHAKIEAVIRAFNGSEVQTISAACRQGYLAPQPVDAGGAASISGLLLGFDSAYAPVGVGIHAGSTR